MEFLLLWYEYKALVHNGGDRAGPSLPPLRWARWWCNTCSGFIVFGGATAAEVEPSERLSFLTISYENSSIFLWCGDYYPTIYVVRWMPPPPTGHPRGGSITIKNTLPSVPRRGPDEGILRIGTIFMVRVWTYRFMPVFTEPFFNTKGHNPSILLTWVTIIWFLFCINDYYWFFR